MNTLNDILKRVNKPGRYIGGETNSVRKTHSADKISVALAYPDAYEIGMSYLGLKILYHLLNERDDVVCERVFAPWPDMEKELLDSGRRLFSLESKTDINKFDILGFSLSYELTYTNVLSMLHLSGITIRASERRDEEPIIIAGGAGSYNPEPMSEFIDAFLIGDAEDALPQFIEKYRGLKAGGLGRKRILKGLASLKGVYVPSLYRASYAAGKFRELVPLEGAPARVEKNAVELENAYYPVKQIVPLIKIIHDRIAVEVMRGCPNRCRFCQASAINRPVRLRSPERVRELCLETYRHTGYEQVSLLSLSSVDYPHLAKLVGDLTEDFKDKGVGVSIPSLRVDEAFYDLPETISLIKKAGLTFAPESASDSMRRAIGKDIDMNVLCKAADLAYRHGWRALKLYFMVGFPGEADSEAEAIVDLARRISDLKRSISKGPAEIKLSVNPFIPKPHTPFQWLGMRDKTHLESVRKLLRARSSGKVIVEFHDLDQSVLEGALSRGDRRLGNVIYSAWEKGARMDGWKEFFNFARWQEAFAENDLDMAAIAGASYSPDEGLPWSHITGGVSSERLKAELMESGLV